jgi:hypothetical protein
MQAAVSNRSAGEKRRVGLRKTGLREDQDRTEGHLSLFSFANDFLKNRSKTIWLPKQANPQARGTHSERRIRNSPSETVAPRNRRLVIDRDPNQFG